MPEWAGRPLPGPYVLSRGGLCAGKLCHPGAEELLRLDDDVIELAKMKRRIDQPATQLAVGNNDAAWPVAVNLVDDIGQRFCRGK